VKKKFKPSDIPGLLYDLNEDNWLWGWQRFFNPKWWRRKLLGGGYRIKFRNDNKITGEEDG